MKTKVIIEDVVLKMDGGIEQELPVNTTIRFEYGKMSYSVSISEDGVLNIHKQDGRLSIYPVASNTIALV